MSPRLSSASISREACADAISVLISPTYRSGVPATDVSACSRLDEDIRLVDWSKFNGSTWRAPGRVIGRRLPGLRQGASLRAGWGLRWGALELLEGLRRLRSLLFEQSAREGMACWLSMLTHTHAGETLTFPTPQVAEAVAVAVLGGAQDAVLCPEVAWWSVCDGSRGYQHSGWAC